MVRLLGVVLFYIILSCSPSFGQWKKIFDFGSPILSVYFKDFTPNPQDGFVSVYTSSNFSKMDRLWKTHDGGKTWQLALCSQDFGKLYTNPYGFTFKDSLEGWSCGFQIPGDIYKTTDGGDTWNYLYSILTQTGSIVYVKSSNTVFCSIIENIQNFPFAASTDGINFQWQGPISGMSGSVGLTFSDDHHGIFFPVTGSPTPKNMAYTEDGGLTWNITPMYSEFFQPIGIPGTSNFFAVCENNANGLAATVVGQVIGSYDGGKTWKNLYTYPTHFATSRGNVTGTMQTGSNMSLFLQTAFDGTEGIMMSTDSGNTFYSICGPINDEDTKFYVRDSFIYAGDKQGGLWLNTTGIGSNSTPELSLGNRLILQTTDCKAKDSIITVSFFDSCNGIQAKLLDASIPGTSNFSLIAPFNTPRTLHPNDSIIIHYDPLALVSDSASLHLRFHLGWKDFDTVVQLIGFASSNAMPKLSLTSLNFQGNCDLSNSLITFSYFDSCSGIQATLLNAQIQGSNTFSLLAPSSFPRVIHLNDSLLVSYDPQTPNKDTAKLLLHFQLGNDFFDTTIQLLGAGRVLKANVQLIPAPSAPAARAGEYVNVYVFPDQKVSGVGLQNISFDLSYIGDLLDIIGSLGNITTAIPGAVIKTAQRIHAGRMETLPVTITGNDLSLDPKSPVATVKFMAMVTDTTSTPIKVSNVVVNNAEPNFNNCILSVTSLDTTFSLEFVCGDSNVSHFLHTGQVLFNISIRPNPARDELEIDLHSAAKQDVPVEIFDALGVKVFSQMRNVDAGASSIHLDTKSLPGGMYLVRVGGVGESFLKVR